MKLKRSALIFICASSLIITSCSSNKEVASSSSNKATATNSRKAHRKEVNKVIKTAYKYTGTPYKYGGNDKKGIDCSGLVVNSYKVAGKELPRNTSLLIKAGTEVPIKDIQKGDLLFFATDKGSRKINHVGIVTKVIDPPNEVLFLHSTNKAGVIEDKLGVKYNRESFVKAIRIP